MEATFLYPWFAFAAAAVAVGAGVLGFRKRLGPMLLLIAAAAMLLAGARPQVGAKAPEVRHALVVDVSGSMKSRPEAAALVDGLQLPAGHSFVRYELSDALRASGGARGEGTDYRRLADVSATINGEIVVITDGRGKLEELYEAVDPRRLIVLRAPEPVAPDAAILDISAPTAVPLGGTAMLRATVRCDAAARVPWRLLDGAEELATGESACTAHVPGAIELALQMKTEGVRRLRLLLELSGDRETRNDEAEVAVTVGSKRRIEYCAGGSIPRSRDALYQMLVSDTGNDVHPTGRLPVGASALDGVALVVINNLPSADDPTAHAALADWVSRGGSLLMIGTDGAFGPGGYRGSAIEEVMPVRFRPDDAPPRRVVLLLDTSASMGEALTGGGTRLDRLKEGARRVLKGLGDTDLGAVIGFRESVVGQVRLLPARDAELQAQVESLAAAGSTHIATSLEQTVAALEGSENARIVMVTDGEDVEGAELERYEALAARLDAARIRLDVVLTEPRELAWTGWIAGGNRHVWPALEFDHVLEALETAVADADKEWIVSRPTSVDGVAESLPRIVRTAERADGSVTVSLRAKDGEKMYPLLARRQLVGRTACLTTDSWGDAELARFWGDATFGAELARTLEFLLANAGTVRLVLNPLEEGAELVWAGEGDAPVGDLRTSDGLARLDRAGRWLLDTWPAGDEVAVFEGDRLIQKIALPKLVPSELRATGDDPVFFAAAEEGGIRVFSRLDAWRPRRFVESAEQPIDVTWAAALAGMVLLLAGYALRRR